MRGGVRLPALVAVIGLLAGCSDPAGAIRRERAAARRHSPSPRPPASAEHPAMAWWQAPGGTKTSGGLRVRTGALRDGRVRIVVTDVRRHVSHAVTASAVPRTATVGRFRLTEIRVAKSPKTHRLGVGFRYRTR
jgi:hypothetical protein